MGLLSKIITIDSVIYVWYFFCSIFSGIGVFLIYIIYAVIILIMHMFLHVGIVNFH